MSTVPPPPSPSSFGLSGPTKSDNQSNEINFEGTKFKLDIKLEKDQINFYLLSEDSTNLKGGLSLDEIIS